jgi:hypothetical protein
MKCYANYDNETGKIITVGNKDDSLSNLEISVVQIDEFINGERSISKFRVASVDNELRIIYTEDDHLVSKSCLVRVEQKEFPKFSVIRNTNNKTWMFKKFVNETFTIFLTTKKSKYNYIRSFELDNDTKTFSFIYDSENGDVDFYTKSSYASMSFKNE